MYFIGNTCFRRKIVYHNKMHLHYPSLKKRLAPSSIKPRTYVFKKVSVTELNYIYVFLILTRRFLLQKSRQLFYDIIYVIIYDIIYFMLAFLLSLSWIRWASRNCLLSWIKRYLHIFLTSNAFFFNLASGFLNFSSVECQILLSWYLIYINICVYIGKKLYLSF